MIDDKVRVGHYGVHWAPGGIAFLEQGGAGQNAAGVDVESPFYVHPFKRFSVSPHLINLADSKLTQEEWMKVEPILTDPLLDVMSPVPRRIEDRCFFFADAERKLIPLLMILSRMSSPTLPLIMPIWTQSFDLHLTNVAPMVITDTDTSRSKLLNNVVSHARSGYRTVVITGDPNSVLNPDFQRKKTDLFDIPISELRELPWERIGAFLLRRYMRNGNPTPH
jgi:hypothetical protein